MTCNFPQRLWVDREEVTVPCGRCEACRFRRAREWGARCLAESMTTPGDSWVHTLTYALNPGTLRYRDVQLWLKRLRKKERFRFFVSGEYGDKFGRPHWHMLTFGGVSDAESWSHGDVRTERLSPAACFYSARYAAKKLGRSERPEFGVDEETGEVVRRVPEFSRMSLRPAIGQEFFDRYRSELVQNGSFVLQGQRYALPRRFIEQLRSVDSVGAAWLSDRRSRVRRAGVSAERAEAVNRSQRLRREFFIRPE